MIYKYFFPLGMLRFHFVDLLSCVETFRFDAVPLVYFFCCQIQNIIVKTESRRLPPMFSFRSFIVSILAFKSLFHFELTFVYGLKIAIQFHSFARGCPIFPTACIEETILFPLV